MDSNMAQPWKEAVSSDNSRDSNAAPNNSCVSGPQPAHHVNCEDEKKSDAMKTSSMETTMKPQSNNGYGGGINDRIRFGNSSKGCLENLMANRHLHANDLNDKKMKVEEKVNEQEKTNRPLQVNGLNNKNTNIVVKEKENRHFHANGLNDKNLNEVEKGEKIGRKEKENSPLQDTGLNHKFIEMAAEWNGIRAKAEREYWRRETEQKESRAEAEHKYGNQQRIESEFGGR